MRRVALVASAWLLLAPVARGEDRAEATEPREAATARDDGRRTLRRFPSNLLRSAGGVFHGDNLGTLIAAGTTTAAASFFDDDVAEYIADPDHDFGKSLEDAFALAVVVERHYGWKAGIPAYALASAVAVSRLQRNKHYLSDVLAGATLGYVVGRTVVRVNGGPVGFSKGAQISFSPVVGRRTRAVVVAVTF